MKKSPYSRLNKSFSELRKAGYFAKQVFLCCSSCGWAAIPEDKSNKAVFYHKQESESKEDGKPIYLCWDGNGNDIVNIFSNNGIICEWNGNKDKKIIISNYKD